MYPASVFSPNISDPMKQEGRTSMNILVIEDNKALSQIITEGFSDLGDKVTCASDGAGGLSTAKQEAFDCVILDLMLPDQDGLDVLRSLRVQNMVPVLILSAKDSVADRVAGLDQGADDYLVKPFEMVELVARVRALVRRAANGGRSLLECGPLSMDTAARECRVHGEPLTLRRREFDILELLLRNENQVFTREQIINRVWKKEYEGGSNVVDVHIKYLRDRLRPSHLDRVIMTVRGVGYKLFCPEME